MSAAPAPLAAVRDPASTPHAVEALEGRATVTIDRQSGSVLVALTGELDLASTAVVGPMLDALVKQPHQQLVIDVSGVTFVDCAGLSPLVHAERAVARGHGRVRLRGDCQALRRLTGLMDRAHLPRPTLLAATSPLVVDDGCL